jgi:hypothetical protein
MIKLCTGCGQTKPLTDYYPTKTVSGLNPRCKACIAEYHRQRYATALGRATKTATTRAWVAANTTRWRDYGRQWRKTRRAQQLAAEQVQ